MSSDIMEGAMRVTKTRRRSKPIDLYAHNQEALDAVEAIWAAGERKACVIRPTGTGKAIIAYKLMQLHPNKTFAMIVPSKNIITNQQQAIDRLSPGFDFDTNTDIYTYAGLASPKTKASLKSDAYDYIVLDELHRAGAPTWETGVRKLMETNPNANVIGLTATPIRYNDEGRNMAKLLCDDNVAGNMTLGEAMDQGLLPVPEYILGEYDGTAHLEDYQRRLKNMTGQRRITAEMALAKMKASCATSAENIADILKFAAIKTDGKYVVFCPNITALRKARKECHKWFSWADTEVISYEVHSKSRTSNEKQVKKFDNDKNKNAVRLLFGVNAIGEGIHPNGVDGIIMLRHTQSPNVYLQQIGRAFDVRMNTNAPLIVDLVGNIDDVDTAYKTMTSSTSRDGRHTFASIVPEFKIDPKTLKRAEMRSKLDSMFEPVTISEKARIVLMSL